MQISSNTAVGNYTGQTEQTQSTSVMKNLYTEKLTEEETNALREEIAQNTNAFTFNNTSAQNSVLSLDEQFVKDYEDFQSFLSDIGYEGKAIAELSQEEATALVSEDGFFGVDQTSQRIADFVLNGAAGDESLLRAGKEGILQGAQDAQEMWGGELPDISQQTINKAVEIIDMAMSDMGFSILNEEV